MRLNLISATFLVSALALTSTAHAGFNSREPETTDEKLDMVVTPFMQDRVQGQVFEFNPVTVPGQRCVVFRHREATGMQCFPRSDAPSKPSE